MSGYVVCGSRDWPANAMWLVTAKMIEWIPRGAEVITGGARGVDLHAHFEAMRLGHPTRIFRPDWKANGKRAGILRNLQMLDEEPDAVLAFCNQFSAGTMHMIRETLRREICLHWVKDEDLRHPDIAALDTDYEPISLRVPLNEKEHRMSEQALEYRICWSASSDIGFHGEGDWEGADPGETGDDIEDALAKGGGICDGLEMALRFSGFEWWVETREAGRSTDG